MLTLEIAPNPNCDAVELRVFHDLESPQPVTHVRLVPPPIAAAEGSAVHGTGPVRPATGGEMGHDTPGHPQWYALIGWTLIGRSCQAVARRVDDSGEGVVLLVSGGDAGLRLQPECRQATWQLTDTQQFGLPFLLIGDPQDLRFVPVPPIPS